MLTVPAASQRLTRSLHDAEASADESLLKAIAAMGEVVTTRMEFRDHPAAIHAQPALIRLQRATTAIISAQGEILRAHVELKKAQTVTSGPEEGGCPKWATMATVDEGKQLVA
ncbi:hypothetical protein [Alteriqipengyuania lutimaris]|uniref:Uncharacterized protein n=1 Tax=Alteriqipengyuania lutimaris TaxID=1538146 RepID=A0A395LJ38_9SPHN|nr:hypothetical protein [Alteriqipengyuania lutimaris]MBB3034078.1 hypothetical protein [Alteriqipengyuania lutimaris]RDS76983.1 hypothetical protein DL238_04755 [Alteriqipengyuania lutimaris]